MRHVGHDEGEFSFVLKDFDLSSDRTILEDISISRQSGIKVSEAPSVNEVEEEQIISDLKSLKTVIRQYIINDEIIEAYELLLKYLHEDSDHSSTIYIRLSTLNGLKREMALGIAENTTIKKNQSKYVLNNIIKELEESDLSFQ